MILKVWMLIISQSKCTHGTLPMCTFAGLHGLTNLLTVNDGGDEVGLCHPLDIIVQEIAVKYRHVSNLAKLDGAQTMLLTELTRYVDGHGTQRLFTRNGLLHIAFGCRAV